MPVGISGGLDAAAWLRFQEQLQDKNHLFDGDERRRSVLSALLHFVEK